MLWVAAAAAVLLVVTLAAVFSGPPDLLTNDSNGNKLGEPHVSPIFVNVKVTRENPEVSWHDVTGARTYDAVIENADGTVVLRRDDSSKASTLWLLTAQEYEKLATFTGDLFLRIVAKDGAGLIVGNSRDRKIQVR